MAIQDLKTVPVALTIAGFDPSGGAGVLADIKTFTAFACFGVAAITSLTFQNTTGVFGASHQTAATVRAQMLPLIEDFRIAAAKTGMLPTREIITEVARLFRETGQQLLPAPVVDPVLRSTSGYDLIDDDALDALITELMPLARLITPNIPEAERMTGLTIRDEEGMRSAARSLREMGARAVLIKGGHLKGKDEGGRMKAEERAKTETVATALDVLDDEGRVMLFRGEWVETESTHGTGCTLSAAIAAGLAHGMSLEQSIETAKRFVADGIRHALDIGHGHKPLAIADFGLRNAD
jgi:hydroxymethylpyrimidine kinase/phosphomethylpyrimidine kinase